MGKIAIKPYFTGAVNMGLETHKQVLFDGAVHKQFIWAKEDVSGSNNFRYITGLNEFAPELNKLSAEDKEIQVLSIRKTVASLEASLASNQLDIKDKNFWSKVILLKPDNNTFWSTIEISPSNKTVFLDNTEPEDLIKITAIEAGGFPDIAPNLETAKILQKIPKFYLDRSEATAITATKSGIADARAKAVLLMMYEENVNKLFYVCKAIDVNSTQYKKTTPLAVLFGNMFDYIEGKMEGTVKKETPENFTKIAALDMETLKLRALVKDASFYRFLTIRTGQIYEGSNDTPLGYNILEVVEFLKNPLNEEVLERLMKKTEKYWNE